MGSIFGNKRRRSRHPDTYLVPKALFLLACALCLWLWQEELPNPNADLELMSRQQAPLHNPQHRCFDQKPIDPKNLNPCACPDPTKPTARATYEWAMHHRRVQQYAAATTDATTWLLGDAAMERWNGTDAMGLQTLPSAFTDLFQQHFPRTLVMAAADDSSTELAWHLQNGWQTATPPRVIVLLIGNNDLYRRGCSKRTALAGILNVANALHEQWPSTHILLHALLPCHERYEDIAWINQELERFCQVHPGEWTFLNATSVFESEKGGWVHLTDGRHPDWEGYQAWAPVLRDGIAEVQKKLSKR